MQTDIRPLLFLCTSLIAPTSIAEPPPTISIGYAEACPHMCPYDDNKGFTADIAQEVLESQGWNTRLVAQPWARVVANTNTGKLHSAISTGRNESPLLVYPSEELAMQEDCFYGLADDNWTPDGPGSFVNRKTVVFKGWVMEEPYRQVLGEDVYNASFEQFSIDKHYQERSANVILRHRMHAFWSDSTVFAYNQAKRPKATQEKLKQLGCVHLQKLFIGFSPAYPKLSQQLAKDFDQGMRALRQSGRLATILNKYGLTDWRKKSAPQ